MSGLFQYLAKSKKLRSMTPAWIRRAARRTKGIYRYNLLQWAEENPFAGTPTEWKFTGKSGKKIGIIRDIAQIHSHYLAACQQMDVSYEVFDIFRDDWIELIQKSDYDVFLAWPSVSTTLWKQIFDERMYILVNFLGKQVYPTINETWTYESKRRTRDWLLSHNIPHPRTWVFTDEEEANQFVSNCPLPIVFKSNTGAGANGVSIVRNRSEASQLVKTCFETGFVVDRGDPRDRQWGVILFQEYIPDAKEWRMVRVADSYFCRFKEKLGDFHSGSGTVSWATPPQYLLDQLRDITTAAGFTSMNIDFFETTDGRYLVNEMHTVFGGIEEKNINRNEEAMGRYKYNEAAKKWEFEHGFFYQNSCANLRVEYALNHLSKLK